MRNKTVLFFWVFILVSIADIVGVIFKIELLIQVFKPLILLSLIALYSVSVQVKNKIYVLALVFSFFGDVFLLFSEELFFMLGLGSFLVAHVLFIKLVLNRISTIKPTKLVISSIPSVVVFAVLLFILKDSLNALLIPVIIYGLAISTFGAVSLLDYLQTKSQQSLWMLLGAIVFILSDSILALNKFYVSTAIFEILIMVTYIIAQYFIYKSMVLGKKLN